MERRFHGNHANNAVIYVALGLSYVRQFRLSSHRIYCLSSRGHLVCLVSSFRYNGLATLALAGPSGPRAGPSGQLQALRAHRAGPPGLHAAKTFKRK